MSVMRAKGWFPTLTVVFLAAALTASAQRDSEWRVYKAADGLPETFVTAITIGPRGTVWVRMPNVEAIGRLDGYDLKGLPSPGLGSSPTSPTGTPGSR